MGRNDRYDTLVLNKEFLLFNRCNQSSISTPEPFSPILAFTFANLTWPESALCPVALGTVLKKLYKLLLLAVTKFHGKLGLNSSPKQSHRAMRHFKKKGNWAELTFAKTSGTSLSKGRGKNWPIGDRCVPSNDPRNNFGSSHLLPRSRTMATSNQTLSENTYCTSMEGIRIILVENLLPVKMNQ